MIFFILNANLTSLKSVVANLWRQILRLSLQKVCISLCGCSRLASLCRPRGALSGEPLTRANQTITLALSGWGHSPQASPKVTHSTSRALGVSPWNDVKAIRTYRGQTRVDPGKLIKHTHSLSCMILTDTHPSPSPFTLTSIDDQDIWEELDERYQTLQSCKTRQQPADEYEDKWQPRGVRESNIFS